MRIERVGSLDFKYASISAFLAPPEGVPMPPIVQPYAIENNNKAVKLGIFLLISISLKADLDL